MRSPLIEINMTSGPARPFISVKFTPAGRTQTFLLPDLALDAARPDVAVTGRRCRPSVRATRWSSRPPRVRPSATVTRGIPQLDDRRRPGGRRGDDRRPQGHPRRHRHPAEAPAAGAGGAPHLPAEDPRARPRDEAGAGRAAVRRVAADLLLHGRGPGRLPRAGPRPRSALPHPDRDAADRRPRRGADARRLRLLRAAALLHDLAADVRADLDQDGEAAEPEPEPVQAVGDVRQAEVLPALRAAERQGRGPRRLRRRGRMRQLRQPDRPGGDGCGSCGSGGCGKCG